MKRYAKKIFVIKTNFINNFQKNYFTCFFCYFYLEIVELVIFIITNE